jgi:hypothetical protein
MLRIRRSEDKGCAIFAISGRIEERQVSELKRLLEAEPDGAPVTLDLEEVKLVDREAISFLATCVARGIKLKDCPSYIRKWIEQRER